MKKVFVFIMICLVSVSVVFSQNDETQGSNEKFRVSFPPVSGFFGGGPELNAYTRSGLAFGGGLTYGMDFIMDIPKQQSQNLSAGFRTSYFYNFDSVSALEPLLFLRYYLPFEQLKLPKKEDGPFAQIELGAVLLMESGYYDYAEVAPSFTGGLGLGWRFNFGDYWFVDPSFRFGYPHMWGINITAGFKFKGAGQGTGNAVSTAAVPPEAVRASTADSTKPTLTVSISPEIFNPEKDSLSFNVSARDDSGIASWKLEVYQPESKALFYSASGRGNPPADLKWNGKGTNGETVLSGSNYSFAFSVTDTHGNTASVEKDIKTDVFAIEDDDGTLQIQVSSIIFRADNADFMGLNRETIENNRRIFDSVANLLKTYGDYKIIVEGHANPTTAPGTPERSREERTLNILSEARAQRVVTELVNRGIDRSRLTAAGVGVNKLSVPWDDKDNNWKNRKVNFVLVKEGE